MYRSRKLPIGGRSREDSFTFTPTLEKVFMVGTSLVNYSFNDTLYPPSPWETLRTILPFTVLEVEKRKRNGVKYGSVQWYNPSLSTCPCVILCVKFNENSIILSVLHIHPFYTHKFEVTSLLPLLSLPHFCHDYTLLLLLTPDSVSSNFLSCLGPECPFYPGLPLVTLTGTSTFRDTLTRG